ncbi:hypothetical protein ACFL2V_19070 [Pseudomonadota bacterium]
MKRITGIILTTIILGINLAPLTFAQELNTDFDAKPAQPNLENPNFLIYELRPGESFEDTIYIKNRAQEARTAKIYAADEILTEQGTKGCVLDNQEMKEIGAWIAFDDLLYKFSAEEDKFIDFTISIPEDAEMGDYRGCIAYSQSSEPEEGKISSAVRKIIFVEIKVTDNPREIERKILERTFAPTWFFYTTLGIALLAVIIIWIDKSKKRKK